MFSLPLRYTRTSPPQNGKANHTSLCVVTLILGPGFFLMQLEDARFCVLAKIIKHQVRQTSSASSGQSNPRQGCMNFPPYVVTLILFDPVFVDARCKQDAKMCVVPAKDNQVRPHSSASSGQVTLVRGMYEFSKPREPGPKTVRDERERESTFRNWR